MPVVFFSGKIHKTEHLNVLASGTIMIRSTTGELSKMVAPCVFVSPPNTKRVGYAVTDCVFLNVHGTHERDLEKLENEFISDDYLESVP